MKYIITFLMAILLLSVASAEISTLGAFKQGDCIELIQTCSNCSYITLDSIIYPNSTISYIGINMTQNGRSYNYSCGLSSSLGKYIVNGHGKSEGVEGIWSYDYEVTPSGSMQTTSQALGSIAFIVLLFGLMLLFGFIGWKLLNNDLLWAAGLLFIGLALLMLVYNVWLVYEFKLNYTGTSPDAAVPQIIFYIFMTILTCGLMTAFFLLFTKWKVLKEKFKKAIKPEEEEDKDDLI